MSTVRERLVPPFVETDAEILERGAVCIEALTAGPVYRDKLRREVNYLPELHFTSAQFLLRSFTLRHVDHSAHKFTERAGSSQNRMAYDVNVPDDATWMHDAVVRLPLCFLA